jgi:hypothetical protein
MTCSHGLDDNNCPICRINAFTIPKKSDKIYDLHQNDLKPYYHRSKSKQDIIDEILPNISQYKLGKNTPINHIPEANLLTKLPNFKNRMFQERLNELNMDKSDNFKLLKKISLESPELKFEE